MKSFVSTETYASTLPCQFCGKITNKAMHLEGCKKRHYEDIGFFICDACTEEMKKFLNTEEVMSEQRQ